MTGVTGGTVDGGQLDRMIGTMHNEPWYSSDRFAAGEYGIGSQHHGKKDPDGHSFWTDGQRAGVVDGSITNLSELGWDVPTAFERLLRSPDRTLKALDGSFIIVCLDASDDRLIVGTDKIGSRPCYYTTENEFAFGSGLSPLIEIADEPTVNTQGIADLLLMGHMWGDTTLLEDVHALHPATVLEYDDGEVRTHRYWHPDYNPTAPTEEYYHRLTTLYQRAVDRTAGSTSGDVGIWLSGGLDSRSTISELARNHEICDEFDSLTAYTYDANPGGGINPALAQDVAETLELPIEQVPLTADHFLSVLEKSVDMTDGMVKWNTLKNLSAVFNIEQREPNVLMEGIVGELVGQHLSRYHLTKTSSLVESMYESEAAISAEIVEDILDVRVDPLGSLRKEARRIDEPSFEEEVVDAHFQNYYSRLAHASNPVPRSQAGTRIPYADGDFLSHAAKLPLSWRMGSLPFTDGEYIFGVVKPKIRMIRSLNSELAAIPYERSRLKPTYPYPLHVIGFFVSTAISQLRSNYTYGGKGLAGEWYRSHEEFQQKINELLDSACDRPFFDADTVRDHQRRHLDGDSEEMNVLSPITTVEIWLQRNLD